MPHSRTTEPVDSQRRGGHLAVTVFPLMIIAGAAAAFLLPGAFTGWNAYIVPAGDMAMSLVQIVLIPIVGGLLMRTFFSGFVRRIESALPWISVLAITFVVVAVVSASTAVLMTAGLGLLIGVVLHNLLGYGLGYAVAAALRVPPAARRAVSVEVGMQNSGLASGLATQYFTPEAALPGAVFSVWHNISGGLLASIWGRRPVG